jgi:hypothetical protein
MPEARHAGANLAHFPDDAQQSANARNAVQSS